MSSSPLFTNDLEAIENILHANEKILWHDKPVFIPYLYYYFHTSIFQFLFLILWTVLAQYIDTQNKNIISFFSIIGWAMILYNIGEFVKHIITGRNTIYAYTNERIIIQTKYFKRTILSIYLTKILEMDIQMNYYNKKYEVGTIRLFTGHTYEDEGDTIKKYNYLFAIPNVEQVYNSLNTFTTK